MIHWDLGHILTLAKGEIGRNFPPFCPELRKETVIIRTGQKERIRDRIRVYGHGYDLKSRYILGSIDQISPNNGIHLDRENSRNFSPYLEGLWKSNSGEIQNIGNQKPQQWYTCPVTWIVFSEKFPREMAGFFSQYFLHGLFRGYSLKFHLNFKFSTCHQK